MLIAVMPSRIGDLQIKYNRAGSKNVEFGDDRIDHALEASRRRGIRIRVLLDRGYYGQHEDTNDGAYDQLRSHHIDIRWTPSYYALTHQKALVVDRRVPLVRVTVFDEYAPAARVFLEGFETADGRCLQRLSAADVSSFLARECPRRSCSRARNLACALRSLLRYLHAVGVIGTPLVWAVPSVAHLRDRTLARGLEPAAVTALLASCDRRKLIGRRYCAILLLLSRLGLRAGEVAAVGLDDIDCASERPGRRPRLWSSQTGSRRTSGPPRTWASTTS